MGARSGSTGSEGGSDPAFGLALSGLSGGAAHPRAHSRAHRQPTTPGAPKMNTASRLDSLHRRALLVCLAGGLPASALRAQERPVQAPLPALWWPPERHWQLLRERAPQSPEVQAVMKAQYQLLARAWSQPPHALTHLPAEPRWQGEAAPRRVADSLGEFEQLQALAFLFTLNGQAAYRERALELLRPWARSLAPVAQPRPCAGSSPPCGPTACCAPTWAPPIGPAWMPGGKPMPWPSRATANWTGPMPWTAATATACAASA